MAGNAGMGRPKGARNKRTTELLALVGDGESPVEFGLKIMRDETRDLATRLHAARIIAPYLHPRPLPEGRTIRFDVPDAIATPADLSGIHVNVLKAVASGELALEEGKEVSTIIENHRRIIETTDIAERLAKLEATLSR